MAGGPMILLIMIHLFSPPQLVMPKTLDGWQTLDDWYPSIARSGWPSSHDLFPGDYFANPAFHASERPVPTMDLCEKLVAGFPKDKGVLLYCVDVGRKGTFQ